VTRKLLAELLRGATLPPEIVDRIIATYEGRGRLTMSEDGGQYRIYLQPEPESS
jgi:hypothetical protein